jgi:DNA modification methylase
MRDRLIQSTLFEMKNETQAGPVTCLGITFENDEMRRVHFRKELRQRLPELRTIEGFPIGEDEDILALSDPPYYTACPNPWLNDFIEEWEKEKEEIYAKEDAEYHKEPFAADVSEGKNDPIYNAHSYHTKVPHKAIMKYIMHYTKKGDIVLDGFSGTGMTGVAAQLCGSKEEINSLNYSIENEIILDKSKPISNLGFRKAILTDLSPSASLIAKHYNLASNKESLLESINKVIDKIENQYSWMYETTDETDGSKQCKVNYFVWSDVLVCPLCTSEFDFADVAIDHENSKVEENFNCPSCGGELTKKKSEKAWATDFDELLKVPVRQIKHSIVFVNYDGKKKKQLKRADFKDIELLNKIQQINLENFDIPVYRMPEGDESRRNDRSGLTHLHHFYTKRNLIILSSLYQEIQNHSQSSFMKLVLQSISATLVSKMVRYNLGNRGNGILSGTLYVPSLIAEANVFKVLRKKLKDIVNVLFSVEQNVVLGVQSAESIALNDNSIDYIFTDPPFGANINYSELNCIWEAWLKIFTNINREAVVNRTQQKNISDYQKLMEHCFANYYRVLKPGRWMTVEFSNSQSSVWNAIREAIERAGFIIANVAALDKKQGSFKAVTSTTAVKQDLVISAYKPTKEFIQKINNEKNTEESAWTFVNQHLEQLPVFIGEKGAAELIVERTPRILFDRMVAYHVQNSFNVPISSSDFQMGVEQRFPIRDGMAFLETQIAEYDKKRTLAKDFIQMSLFVSDENSAIEWIRQQLMKKPQTRQDIHPNYMKEIQHIAKHEQLPELDALLEQNFLKYDEVEDVPSQIHTFLSTDYKDLRNLSKNDPALKLKSKDRWYVPDPNKQVDLEKLRDKSLLREFEAYRAELVDNRKKLKQFRTEAIRAGFKKAWGEKDYQTIVAVGERLPENILQEDDKLLMYYDNAQIRLGI